MPVEGGRLVLFRYVQEEMSVGSGVAPVLDFVEFAQRVGRLVLRAAGAPGAACSASVGQPAVKLSYSMLDVRDHGPSRRL